MTSRLEEIRRELADAYMAENPGVPRQEAKRRVEAEARLGLAFFEFGRGARKLGQQLGRMGRAMREVRGLDR